MDSIEGRLELDISTGAMSAWAIIDKDCVSRVAPGFVVFPGEEVIDPNRLLETRRGIVQEAFSPSGEACRHSRRGDPANLLVLWQDGTLEMRDNYSIQLENRNRGLLVLQNGDSLTVFDKKHSARIILSTTVDLEYIDAMPEEAYGHWYELFLEEFPAHLERPTGFHHRGEQFKAAERRKKQGT